jgi:ribonuclease HI
MDLIKAYVDGTFYNGKWGGGYCIFDDDKLIYQDCGIGQDIPELNAMRNISGEMSAAMHATLWIDEHAGKGIIIHDYIGLSKWVTGEWQTTKEYTKMYADFMSPFYTLGIIDFEWVKGHTNVLGNEIADKLARESVVYNRFWQYN